MSYTTLCAVVCLAVLCSLAAAHPQPGSNSNNGRENRYLESQPAAQNRVDQSSDEGEAILTAKPSREAIRQNVDLWKKLLKAGGIFYLAWAMIVPVLRDTNAFGITDLANNITSSVEGYLGEEIMALIPRELESPPQSFDDVKNKTTNGGRVQGKDTSGHNGKRWNISKNTKAPQQGFFRPSQKSSWIWQGITGMGGILLGFVQNIVSAMSILITHSTAQPAGSLDPVDMMLDALGVEEGDHSLQGGEHIKGSSLQGQGNDNMVTRNGSMVLRNDSLDSSTSASSSQAGSADSEVDGTQGGRPQSEPATTATALCRQRLVCDALQLASTLPYMDGWLRNIREDGRSAYGSAAAAGADHSRGCGEFHCPYSSLQLITGWH